MSDEYTPTTTTVRGAYILAAEGSEDRSAADEFERWLAATKAEAIDEAYTAASRIPVHTGKESELANKILTAIAGLTPEPNDSETGANRG